MSHPYNRATPIEHATRHASPDEDWQAAIARRRAQLQETLGRASRTPAAPESVLCARRERRQERVRREVAEAPTPQLLADARELDRRRRPMNRSAGRPS